MCNKEDMEITLVFQQIKSKNNFIDLKVIIDVYLSILAAKKNHVLKHFIHFLN